MRIGASRCLFILQFFLQSHFISPYTWHRPDGTGRHLRRHTYQFPIISNNNNVIDACSYDVGARVAPLKYRVVMLRTMLRRMKARKFRFDYLFLERVKR